MCRQVMAEFAGPDLLVRSRTLKQEEAQYTLRDLLPHAFTRDFL
jgi:cytidine deaminase